MFTQAIQSNVRSSLRGFLVLFYVLTALVDCSAQSKRVKPPDWRSIDVSDIFFDDAHREALQGERPPHLLGKQKRTSAMYVPPSTNGGAKQSADQFPWPSIISNETIEDEVKRLAKRLDKSVAQPATFAAGGHRQARQQFSTLAVLFSIIHEYDGTIRWKSYAAAARDRFAYVGSITKVGTVQAYRAARESKAELAGLIRGSRVTKEPVARQPWTELLDRGPLMQRLEHAHQGTIEPALASAAEMRSQAQALLHEAEIAAALAQILVYEGLDEWDEPQYARYCEQLKQGAAAVIQAVKQNDYDSAVNASGVISKSCSNCHESYRG